MHSTWNEVLLFKQRGPIRGFQDKKYMGQTITFIGYLAEEGGGGGGAKINRICMGSDKTGYQVGQSLSLITRQRSP